MSVNGGWKFVSIGCAVVTGNFGVQKVQCYVNVQVTYLLDRHFWFILTYLSTSFTCVTHLYSTAILSNSTTSTGVLGGKNPPLPALILSWGLCHPGPPS